MRNQLCKSRAMDRVIYERMAASQQVHWWFAGRRLAGYWAICTILLIASLAPIWMVTLPPLDDYPNHLARMHILMDEGRSEVLSQFYDVRWSVIPNLAMDIIVPPLATLMPLEVAGKVFVTLVIALLATGSLALHYAIHKRLSLWPLLAFLFLYNGIFLLGILNFLFGLGLCFWALAAWIRSREYGDGTRAAMFYTTCFVLFFAHLSAMGVYALSVIAYEASDLASQKISVARLLRWLGLLVAGPLVLLAVLILSSELTTNEAPPFMYGSVSFAISHKVGALYLLVRNYVQPLDIATLGLLIWIFVFGLLTRLVRFDDHMRWSAAAIAVAGLCLPYQVMGSNFADARVLLGAAFLFLCATDIRAKREHLVLFAVLVVAVFGGRMLIVGNHWQGTEALYKQLSSAVKQIPRGSRLLAVSSRDPDRLHQAPGPNLAATAVIQKDVFLPSMYAMPPGQPLVFTERHLGLARNAPKPDQWMGDMITWRRIEQDYDFILLTGNERLVVPPPNTLVPVFASTGFQLYKTRRTAWLEQ
jgi:hypothetical protein